MTTFRKVLFWIHLLIGSIFGLVIAVMSVTGMMLAFKPQILALSDQSLHQVRVPSDASPLRLTEMVERIKAERPKARVRDITLNTKPDASIGFNLGRNEGVIYMNPYTGEILGSGSRTAAWLKDVEIWHRWLGLQGERKALGASIREIANLGMIVLILSGLYLWWPFKAIRIKRGISGQAKDFNRHTAIGFWAFPFLLVITVTGAIMTHFEPAGPGKSREPGTRTSAPIDWDLALAAVQQALPHWKSLTIRPGGSHILVLVEESESRLHWKTRIKLDPANYQVISRTTPSQLGPAQQLRVWARYLHTGEAGGIIVQTIWFVATGAVLVLIWTGYKMTYRRFFQRKGSSSC